MDSVPEWVIWEWILRERRGELVTSTPREAVVSARGSEGEKLFPPLAKPKRSLQPARRSIDDRSAG